MDGNAFLPKSIQRSVHKLALTILPKRTIKVEFHLISSLFELPEIL